MENNRKGRLKTLIGDFQTTFVFAGWSVRILEIQFRFQPVSTRHADDGEAAVVLPALYLPVVFVEQVFYRAADGQGVFAQLGFVACAYVNQGIGWEGVLFLRILVRLAEVRNVAVQGQAFGKRCIPFHACFGNHARVGDLYAVNQIVGEIRIIFYGLLQIHQTESRTQGFVQQVGIGIELDTAAAFYALLRTAISQACIFARCEISS